jgi:hypothetical protein
MHPADRKRTEELLTEITRMGSSQPLIVGGAVGVHQVRLLTSLAVVAKGL